MQQLENDHNRVKANCDYYIASNKFHEQAGLILEWDTLPSLQKRSAAISGLESAHAEARKHVHGAGNPAVESDFKSMDDTISRCHAHIEALAKKDAEDREAEAERQRQQRLKEEAARKVAGLRDYFNELEMKLSDARNQILQRLALAIQFESPQAAAHDAQKCLNGKANVHFFSIFFQFVFFKILFSIFSKILFSNFSFKIFFFKF